MPGSVGSSGNPALLPPCGAPAKKDGRRRRRSLLRDLGPIRVRSLDHASSRRRRRRRFRRSHHRRLRRRFDENAAGRLRRGRLSRGLSRKRLLILGLAVGLKRRKLRGIEERCRREAALLLPLPERGSSRGIQRSSLWSRIDIERAQTLLNFLLARRAQVQRPFGVGGRDAVFQRIVFGTTRLRHGEGLRRGRRRGGPGALHAGDSVLRHLREHAARKGAQIGLVIGPPSLNAARIPTGGSLAPASSRPRIQSGLATGFAFSAAGSDVGCGLSSYSPISDVLTHGN